MSDSSSSAEAGPSSRPMTSADSSSGYRPNPSFSFPSAFQPSIIRSFQKDAYYLSLLRSQLHDVSRTVLGSRFLQQHGQSVSLVAALGYHIFTTWDGAQTLGEEYVGSRMVASSSRQGPDAGSFVSKQRRIAFILMQVLAPFVLSRVYARLRRRLNASNAARQQALQRRVLRARAVGAADGEEPKPSRLDRMVAALCRWLPSLESLNRADGWLAYGTAVHLMLFYLGGRYYKVAQRIVGVQYISIHPSPPGQEPPSYEVLGVLLGVQLGVKLALALNRHLHRRAAASKAAAKKRHQQAGGAGGGNEKNEEKEPSEAQPTVDVDGRLWSHKSAPARPVSSGLRDQGLGEAGHEDDDEEGSARDYSALAPPGPRVPLVYPSSTSTALLNTSSSSSSNAAAAAVSTAQLVAAPLESSSNSMLRCTLCMDERQPHRGTSAATECGHVFDWSCIMSWLREKGECPLCRQAVMASRVVPIYNL